MVTRILGCVIGSCYGGRCKTVINTQRVTDHRNSRATCDQCDRQDGDGLHVPFAHGVSISCLHHLRPEPILGPHASAGGSFVLAERLRNASPSRAAPARTMDVSTARADTDEVMFMVLTPGLC